MNRTRSAVRHVPAFAWAACAVLMAGPTAMAQEAPPPPTPPPTFLIESVVVEGTDRASTRRIVRSESRLEEGQVYDEEAIRFAVRRVKRLPFVLDARPTLRRGSTPGQYQLVIEVEETAVMTLAGTATLYESSARGALSLGANHFFGANSQLSASARISHASFTGSGVRGDGRLSFARYDVAGQGSRALVELSVDGEAGYEAQAITGSLLLPLGKDHTLGLGVIGHRSRNDIRPFPPGTGGGLALGQATGWGADAFAEWVFDTTDDPFAARDGSLLRAGARVSASRIDFGSFQPDFSGTGAVLSGAMGMSWPLWGKISGVAAASLGCSVVDRTDCDTGAAGGLRFVHEGPRNKYRGFVEALVSRSLVSSNALDGSIGAPRANVLTVTAGLRTRFAVLRLSFVEPFE